VETSKPGNLKNGAYNSWVMHIRTMKGEMSRSDSSFAMVLRQWTWGICTSSLWTDKSTTATFCPLHTHCTSTAVWQKHMLKTQN